jgi:hypothetical protein
VRLRSRVLSGTHTGRPKYLLQVRQMREGGSRPESTGWRLRCRGAGASRMSSGVTELCQSIDCDSVRPCSTLPFDRDLQLFVGTFYRYRARHIPLIKTPSLMKVPFERRQDGT